MLAHADATGTLTANGTLSISCEDPLNAQLQQITEQHHVDDQLAAMRQQL